MANCIVVMLIGILTGVVFALPAQSTSPCEKMAVINPENAHGCTDIDLLCDGTELVLSGTFCDDHTQFSVSLEGDDGIALRFDVRFGARYVAKNSRRETETGYGVWGDEERQYLGFPFEVGDPFDISFVVDDNTIQIEGNGERMDQFTLRDGFSVTAIRRVCYRQCGSVWVLSIGPQ